MIYQLLMRNAMDYRAKQAFCQGAIVSFAL